jgi:hypothetical protein
MCGGRLGRVFVNFVAVLEAIVESGAPVAPSHAKPTFGISDCCLANGQSGVAAIAEVRLAFGASIPAFLITGDTSPEWLHEAPESGHHLLHKPVGQLVGKFLSQRFGMDLFASRPA